MYGKIIEIKERIGQAVLEDGFDFDKLKDLDYDVRHVNKFVQKSSLKEIHNLLSDSEDFIYKYVSKNNTLPYCNRFIISDRLLNDATFMSSVLNIRRYYCWEEDDDIYISRILEILSPRLLNDRKFITAWMRNIDFTNTEDRYASDVVDCDGEPLSKDMVDNNVFYNLTQFVDKLGQGLRNDKSFQRTIDNHKYGLYIDAIEYHTGQLY